MPTNKKVLYVDMDGVLCDFEKAHQNDLAIKPEIAYPQSQYGFFRKLQPMPHALDSMQCLQRLSELDIYILTAPSIHNPLCYSEKREWIETHIGFEWVKKLIISPNKGLSKGHYLIDDHKEGRGQELFEGELLHFGSERFPDWHSIIEFFTLKYTQGAG